MAKWFLQSTFGQKQSEASSPNPQVVSGNHPETLWHFSMLVLEREVLFYYLNSSSA
jgi:hypothetical protein